MAFTYPTMTSDTSPSPYVTSASSTYNSSYLAWNAADNNTGTRWNSNNVETSAGSWWKIYFASLVCITSLTIRNGGYHSGLHDFKLQGSCNNIDWTDLHTGHCVDDTNDQSYTIVNANYYSYYRVLCVSGYNANALTITTIFMAGYNMPSYPEPDSFLLRGRERVFIPRIEAKSEELATYETATITTDSEYSGSYLIGKAFDGDINTRWASAVGSLPNWIHIDFGAGNEKAIVGLKYYPEAARPTNFTFSGSNNNSDWVELLAVTGATTGWQSWYFSNVTQYRYYKMDITASSDNLVSIWEVQLVTKAAGAARPNSSNVARRMRLYRSPVSRAYV